MAQDLQRATFKNFSKGLVTDRSPLNAEPNTMADVQNMVLNRDGSVQRRKKFDVLESPTWTLLESHNSGDLNPEEITGVSSFLWEGAGESGDSDIIMIHAAGRANFFFASNKDFLNSIDTPSKTPNQDMNLSVATSGNQLILTSEDDDRIDVFEYDSSTATVNFVENKTIKVRDLWGWEPKKGIQERYRANSDAATDPTSDEATDFIRQAYERINRGWTLQSLQDYSDYQVTNGADDVFWLPPLASSPQMYKDNNLAVDFSLEDSIFFGNSPSRGSSIVIDLFERGPTSSSGPPYSRLSNDERYQNRRTVASDIAGLISGTTDSILDQAVEDVSTGGIKDVGYFYGRFWYVFTQDSLSLSDKQTTELGEQQYPQLESLVAFSTITSDNRSLNTCFQEADPTSEFISDRIPTDGGTISIQDMRNPRAITEFAGGILVFAKNGIWYITSGSEGFNPTSFIVKKISNFGALTKWGIVKTSTAIYFLGEEDIYKISLADSDWPAVQNISFNIIGNYYDNIRKGQLRACRSCYDSINKKIIWQWADYGEGFFVFQSPENALATHQLIYDVINEAFTVNTIDAREDTKDVSFLGPPVFLPISVTDDPRVLYTILRHNSNASTEYEVTFGDQKGSGFKDFSTQNTGAEADAFFILNHYAGDAQVQNQVPTLTTHSKLTETGLKQDANGDYTILENPGSIKVQAYWDFTDKLTGWGNPDEFQAYKLPRAYLSDSTNGSFDYGKTVITTNNKIEGRGRALQLKFSTEPEHDFHLYGVTMLTASNQTY